VGSATGQVSFFNLVTGDEAHTFKLRSAITKLSVVADPRQAIKYLLVQTEHNGCFRVLLEHEPRPHMCVTLLSAQKMAPSVVAEFGIETLRQFGQDSEVTVQDTKFGPIIGVMSRQSRQLEIYGAELGKFPLFVFQLPPGTVGFHFTRTVTFAFVEASQAQLQSAAVTTTASPSSSGGSSPQATPLSSSMTLSSLGATGNILCVVSNLIAGTSTMPKYYTRTRSSSVMQRFGIGQDERFGGSFYMPSANGGDLSSSEDGSDVPQSSSSAESSLQGCYIWTSKGLYQCKPTIQPEKLFFQLVSQGLERSDAEDFGKTLGLDLFTLYEQAADSYFADHDYGRALDLYSLSNVRTSKLVTKFLSIGRHDIVVTHIRGLLHQPDALPGSDRKMLSDVLL
jgi:hypothetical protein